MQRQGTKLDKPKNSTTRTLLPMGIACVTAFMVAGTYLWLVMPPLGSGEGPAASAMVSLPFGLAFTGLLYFLKKLSLQKAKWTLLSVSTVVVDLILIVWLFLICLEWLHYWTRIWTI